MLKMSKNSSKWLVASIMAAGIGLLSTSQAQAQSQSVTRQAVTSPSGSVQHQRQEAASSLQNTNITRPSRNFIPVSSQTKTSSNSDARMMADQNVSKQSVSTKENEIIIQTVNEERISNEK